MLYVIYTSIFSKRHLKQNLQLGSICDCPSDLMQSRLTGEDPDAGKDRRQEKEVTEGEMRGWHHWLEGREFEQTSGNGEDQGSLVCFSQWGHRIRHDGATVQLWQSETEESPAMSPNVFQYDFFFKFQGPPCIVVILLYIKTVNEQRRPTNAFTSGLQ